MCIPRILYLIYCQPILVDFSRMDPFLSNSLGRFSVRLSSEPQSRKEGGPFRTLFESRDYRLQVLHPLWSTKIKPSFQGGFFVSHEGGWVRTCEQAEAGSHRPKRSISISFVGVGIGSVYFSTFTWTGV